MQDRADKIAELNSMLDRAGTFTLSSILQVLQKLALIPRLRSRPEAAAYCGITPETFDDWVRKGLLPGPIRGTRRWDVRAIDLALDRHSSIDSSSTANNALDEWKAKRNG